MVELGEAGFRGENLPTDLPESIFGVWNSSSTTRALGSVAGWSSLTGEWTPLVTFIKNYTR